MGGSEATLISRHGCGGAVLPPHEIDFVNRLIDVLLEYKFICISGMVYQRKQGLSTGEQIATDAANIHRVTALSSLKANAGCLKRSERSYAASLPHPVDEASVLVRPVSFAMKLPEQLSRF